MLSLVLVLSLASYAAEPADAPVILAAGDPAPVAGVLLPNNLAVRRAKELTALRAETEALKKETGTPVALVVALIVVGVVAGGAAGYGVARATRRSRPAQKKHRGHARGITCLRCRARCAALCFG
jgi:hypothetical protein